jgi:hypothetical protein
MDVNSLHGARTTNMLDTTAYMTDHANHINTYSSASEEEGQEKKIIKSHFI